VPGVRRSDEACCGSGLWRRAQEDAGLDAERIGQFALQVHEAVKRRTDLGLSPASGTQPSADVADGQVVAGLVDQERQPGTITI
jgi:hypothetical protein